MDCERCAASGRPPVKAVKGERYCNGCKKFVLKELEDSGYLTKLPFIWRPRSEEQQQHMEEDDSPWQQNALRDLEGDGLEGL